MKKLSFLVAVFVLFSFSMIHAQQSDRTLFVDKDSVTYSFLVASEMVSSNTGLHFYEDVWYEDASDSIVPIDFQLKCPYCPKVIVRAEFQEENLVIWVLLPGKFDAEAFEFTQDEKGIFTRKKL